MDIRNTRKKDFTYRLRLSKEMVLLARARGLSVPDIMRTALYRELLTGQAQSCVLRPKKNEPHS